MEGTPVRSPPPIYRPPSPIPGKGVPQSPIGLYGWRKRCLYLLILVLVAVMLVNLGLTIWILVVLDFNQNGMGNLDISDSGIRLDGSAEFIGPLYAENISTDQGAPLKLQSDTGISISVRNGSSFELGNSSLSISAQRLAFSTAAEGQPRPSLLSVDEAGVSIGATQVEVTGTLGASVAGPVETGSVQSPSNSDLHLQSLSGAMVMTAAGRLVIQDSSGSDVGISLTSNADLTLTSQAGQVVLDSPNVLLQGIARTADSATYEVCVCGGPTPRLYLVPATSTCQQDNNICTA